MFQIKLHLRNGKSKYRGKIKVKCSSILRSIAINYKRVHAYQLKEVQFYFVLKKIYDLRIFLMKNNKIICSNF